MHSRYSRFAVLALLLASTTLQAQWLNLRTPDVPRTAEGRVNLAAPTPRTPDGKPDLSGMWVPTDARGSLFEPANIQDWALQEMARHERNFFADDPRFACLPSGPGAYPAGGSVGGTRRIVQNPDVIAVLNPDYTWRQIFTDGRELEEPLIPTWMGYSVGRWEGDTLIVESNGFNNLTWLTREGLPHTDQLLITERYRRPDYGHIELDITYNDPGTFKNGPVQANIIMAVRVDSEIMEIVCNEGSESRDGWHGEVSQAEGKNIEISEEVLQSYVGTYKGVWLGNQITAEVRMRDGEMTLVRTPPYSDTGGNAGSATYQLLPQSENAFDCTCGLGFVFKFDAAGKPNAVSEVHVSGEWIFPRVEP